MCTFMGCCVYTRARDRGSSLHSRARPPPRPLGKWGGSAGACAIGGFGGAGARGAPPACGSGMRAAAAAAASENRAGRGRGPRARAAALYGVRAGPAHAAPMGAGTDSAGAVPDGDKAAAAAAAASGCVCLVGGISARAAGGDGARRTELCRAGRALALAGPPAPSVRASARRLPSAAGRRRRAAARGRRAVCGAARCRRRRRLGLAAGVHQEVRLHPCHLRF
jgi:hypothetical protein